MLYLVTIPNNLIIVNTENSYAAKMKVIRALMHDGYEPSRFTITVKELSAMELNGYIKQGAMIWK